MNEFLLLRRFLETCPLSDPLSVCVGKCRLPKTLRAVERSFWGDLVVVVVDVVVDDDGVDGNNVSSTSDSESEVYSNLFDTDFCLRLGESVSVSVEMALFFRDRFRTVPNSSLQ